MKEVATEAEYDQTIVEINRLLRKGEAKLSPEKDRLLDLLSTLNDHSCWVISACSLLLDLLGA